MTPENARRVSEALIAFDFPPESVPPEMFLERPKVFRFGREPMRIELLTQPSGVDFAECFAERVMGEVGGVLVPIIRGQRAGQGFGRPEAIAVSGGRRGKMPPSP